MADTMILAFLAFLGVGAFVFSFLPQLLSLRREERRLNAEIDALIRLRRERRARLRERVEKT